MRVKIMAEIKPDRDWIYLGCVLPARKIATIGLLTGHYAIAGNATNNHKSCNFIGRSSSGPMRENLFYVKITGICAFGDCEGK